MSYILDALRKADAQRDRDPARGIHAQTLHAAASADWAAVPHPGSGRRRIGVAATAGAGWLVYQAGPRSQRRLPLESRLPCPQ